MAHHPNLLTWTQTDFLSNRNKKDAEKPNSDDGDPEDDDWEMEMGSGEEIGSDWETDLVSLSPTTSETRERNLDKQECCFL